MNKRIGLMIGGVAAAAVMVGGTAYGAVSSIPDSAGAIHGCYDAGGNVKVINTSVTTTCPKGFSSLNWSQKGPAGTNGTDGTNGTNAAPEFTWTTSCSSGSTCAGRAATSIPAGTVLTPVAISATGGCTGALGADNFVAFTDASGRSLADEGAWSAPFPAFSTLDGADTTTTAGSLQFAASGDCSAPVTFTFTFDETQSYS